MIKASLLSKTCNKTYTSHTLDYGMMSYLMKCDRKELVPLIFAIQWSTRFWVRKSGSEAAPPQNTISYIGLYAVHLAAVKIK